MKGVNYAVAPKSIPIEEIIWSVQVAMKYIEPETAEEIWQDLSLSNYKNKATES